MAASTTAQPGWFGLAAELSKARLSALAVFTTLVGFRMAGPADFFGFLLLNTLVGTAALAGGAAALNQYLESGHDARMPRTRGRPLPAGHVQPQTALLFGAALSAFGMIFLAITVNLLTSFLGAITLVTYIAIYTPLKRITPLNTIVGAIPGALPPLMGWTAVRNDVTLEGWTLFAILFFWQLPHFLAIAWLYREDYAGAGFMMLPVVDPDGSRTGRHAVSHALGLLPVSIAPYLFHLAGPLYLAAALILGLAFVGFAIRFARRLAREDARRLFYMSIIYLPLLLGLMMVDKVK